jgi:hypothetical protein
MVSGSLGDATLFTSTLYAAADSDSELSPTEIANIERV